MNTRGCTAVCCRIRSDLYVQKEMILNRGFEFLLLDPDVALGDCSAAVLQELLDQGHVVAVCLVDLGGKEFPEAVGADALVSEEIADKFQMLLDLPLREGEKRRDVMVPLFSKSFSCDILRT